MNRLEDLKLDLCVEFFFCRTLLISGSNLEFLISFLLKTGGLT